MIDQNELARVQADAELLWSNDQVGAALDRMAGELNTRFAGGSPLLLCVMNGALMTTAHLATRLRFNVEMDYLHVTRYRGGTEGGELQWRCRPEKPLRGREVLLIDDIFDEGQTLAAIHDYCRDQGAAAVYAAVLVNKIHDRKVSGFFPDLIGLEVDDRYVFGFGMDYHDQLRHLAGIYALA